MSKVTHSLNMSTEKPYVWQDDAACATSNPAIFEYVDEDHPAGVGIEESERFELNANHFAAAKKICDVCPVQMTCDLTSTRSDRRYTFRAGKKPGEAGHALVQLLTPAALSEHEKRDRICKAGHTWNRTENSNPNNGCPTCRRERQVEYRAARKAAGLPRDRA